MSQLQKNQLLAEARQILNKKPFTREDSARFDRLMELAAAEDNNEALNRARLAKQMDESNIPRTPFDDNEARASFRKYVRTGVMDNSIRGAMTTDSGSGGAIIPQLFFNELTSILKQYDRLFDPDVVTIVRPTSGAPMGFPLLDDVSQSATIIADNIVSVETTPLVFAQLAFTQCPTWRSGWITMPNQLLQDSGIPIENMLVKALGVRIARGAGANIVSTLLSAALVGATAAGSATNTGGTETGGTTVGTDDLYSLVSSVDPAYTTSPQCGWAMSFQTLLSLLKTKDKQGRPIIPAVHNDAGDFLLLEKPVFLCPSMPAIGANSIPIAFGDFSRLVVRFVKDSQTLIRAVEAHGCADNYATGFQGYLRAQAGLALDSAQSPADSPIKLLKNAAA